MLMADYDDIPEPARRHLTAYSQQLDALAGLPTELVQLKKRIAGELPSASLAAELSKFLDAAGGYVQDTVHSSRARLAEVADMARQEQQQQRRVGEPE